MNQVTEHDDMLAGMHPRIDVFAEEKRSVGFRGAQRAPGFYRASAYRGFRGSRICWWDKTCHVEEAEYLFCRVESPTTFRAKAVPDHNIQACEVFVVRFQSVCSFGRKAEVAAANRPLLQYLLELARQPKQQPNFLEVLTRNGKK